MTAWRPPVLLEVDPDERIAALRRSLAAYRECAASFPERVAALRRRCNAWAVVSIALECAARLRRGGVFVGDGRVRMRALDGDGRPMRGVGAPLEDEDAGRPGAAAAGKAARSGRSGEAAAAAAARRGAALPNAHSSLGAA